MSSTPLQRATDVLEIVASELTYLPTPEQRKAKSAFWLRFNDNPICDPQDISLAIVMRLVGDERLTRWWPVSGFKEWFRNREEFRERMEYLSQLAMDQLEEILAAPMAIKGVANAKISAAKLIMEVARKMPPKTATAGEFLDAKVADMNKRQLEEFIGKHIKLVSPATKDLTAENTPDTVE